MLNQIQQSYCFKRSLAQRESEERLLRLNSSSIVTPDSPLLSSKLASVYLVTQTVIDADGLVVKAYPHSTLAEISLTQHEWA